MSMHAEYYSNYGSLSPEEYFKRYIIENADENARYNYVIDNLPTDFKSIIDIGCGCGYFLCLLKKRFLADVLGIEINMSKLLLAHNNFNLDVFAGSAGSLPIKTRSFDMVTAFEVLEHLPFLIYEEALEEMQRVAKKYIVITVPYREKRENITCPYCGCKFNETYHLRSFEENQLKELFSDFEVKKMSGLGEIKQIKIPFMGLFNFRSKRQINPFMVCPQCGYKNPSNSQCAIEGKSCFDSKIKKSLLQIIPKSKTYRWTMVIYQRKHS